jgi:amino acid transporter
MSTDSSASGTGRRGLLRTAQVIVVSSVMFTFISYWRTAAVVLCDLASTAYYIGGIVEQAIGPAAPWFILAVMLFSYAVRSVYLESCSLFVRGGVYRVVKEAMGGFLAKLSVSALMFDYILTGPISGVSAGAYLAGLILDTLSQISGQKMDQDQRTLWMAVISVTFAVAVTLYFFWQNLKGIHESSDKALKIMVATTIMAVIVIGWCMFTLIKEGPKKPVNVDATLSLNPGSSDSVWIAPPLYEQKVQVVSSSPGSPLDLFVVLAKDEAVAQEVANALAQKGKTPGDALASQLGTEQARLVVTVPARRGFALVALNRGKKVEAQVKATSNALRYAPEFSEKPDYSAPDPEKAEKVDPLGFISHSGTGDSLRGLGSATPWLSAIGVMGVLLAFSHSILAMSGEETLAQVYREVEAPKMANFKKAAFVVFVYSLVLTGGISFLAVLLIPDKERMPVYNANLIGGLAMNVWEPVWTNGWARLCLQAFVVVVGAAILSGAVNTAIIGSNGVLNRVAEDGVMPDWFLKPHRRYGTTYRMLYLIVGLQLFTILVSRGDIILLGEAYAFGVVWSFVFKALAMVVLRFTEPGGREFKVPLNVHWGRYEIPIGLGLIFLVLLTAALLNLLTKQIATISGLAFTASFLTVFMVTERLHEKRRQGQKHEHQEQFNQQTAEEVTPEMLKLAKPYRKLVAIRSPQNLFMLEQALAETDPETTNVVVMTAKMELPNNPAVGGPDLDTYDQQLMTAVVNKAEHIGKPVTPLIVPTNNPLFAVLRTAKALQAQELIMGASNKYTADEQLEQIGFYWISMHDGETAPLTVRILNRDRDVYLDLGGGNRIPKISERKARSVAELRAAGVGIDQVLLVHAGSPASSDLFQGVLTMLDPEVGLAMVSLVPKGREPYNGHNLIRQDQERARQLGRQVEVHTLDDGPAGPQIVRLAKEKHFDAIVLALPRERPAEVAADWTEMIQYVMDHAHSPVLLATPPLIPQEVSD